MGLLLALMVTAAVSETDSPSTSDDAVRVATFDAVWRIIHETHFDPTFNGVNWEAVRSELRPKAEAARNNPELREVIKGMLDRLQLSHMVLLPHAAAASLKPSRSPGNAGLNTKREPLSSSSQPRLFPNPARPSHGGGRLLMLANRAAPMLPAVTHDPDPNRSGDPGFEVRQIGKSFVVTRVTPDGPAAKAGIQRGWILEAVGDYSITQLLAVLPKGRLSAQDKVMAWSLVTSHLLGRPDSTVRCTFKNQANRRVTQDLQRQRVAGAPVKLGHLPTMFSHLQHQRLSTKSGASLGLIRFNLWMLNLAADFDQALDELRDTDGIILDLRGNVGGIMTMISGISGHFLKEEISLGTVKMRDASLQIMANPRLVNAAGQRVQPYGGPVAILVDELSLSATEVFAGGMQSIGRARIFGQTTLGQALPALFDELPNGDVLLHALGDFVTATGARLEGRGVIPDSLVPRARRNLIKGQDATLEAAVDWITQRKSSGVAHAGTRSP